MKVYGLLRRFNAGAYARLTNDGAKRPKLVQMAPFHLANFIDSIRAKTARQN
jgi:hypothetical protein